MASSTPSKITSAASLEDIAAVDLKDERQMQSLTGPKNRVFPMFTYDVSKFRMANLSVLDDMKFPIVNNAVDDAEEKHRSDDEEEEDGDGGHCIEGRNLSGADSRRQRRRQHPLDPSGKLGKLPRAYQSSTTSTSSASRSSTRTSSRAKARMLSREKKWDEPVYVSTPTMHYRTSSANVLAAARQKDEDRRLHSPLPDIPTPFRVVYTPSVIENDGTACSETSILEELSIAETSSAADIASPTERAIGEELALLKSCISLREAYLRNLMEAIHEGVRPGPGIHLSNILSARTKLTAKYLRPQIAAIRKSAVKIILSINRLTSLGAALPSGGEQDAQRARPEVLARKYLQKICHDLLVLDEIDVMKIKKKKKRKGKKRSKASLDSDAELSSPPPRLLEKLGFVPYRQNPLLMPQTLRRTAGQGISVAQMQSSPISLHCHEYEGCAMESIREAATIMLSHFPDQYSDEVGSDTDIDIDTGALADVDAVAEVVAQSRSQPPSQKTEKNLELERAERLAVSMVARDEPLIGPFQPVQSSPQPVLLLEAYARKIKGEQHTISASYKQSEGSISFSVEDDFFLTKTLRLDIERAEIIVGKPIMNVEDLEEVARSIDYEFAPDDRRKRFLVFRAASRDAAGGAFGVSRSRSRVKTPPRNVRKMSSKRELRQRKAASATAINAAARGFLARSALAHAVVEDAATRIQSIARRRFSQKRANFKAEVRRAERRRRATQRD